jgi:hypothetical protein
MAAKTLANNLPAVYRDGAEMVGHVAAAATFDGRRANAVAATPMRQQPFLQQVLARLADPEGAGAAHVLAQLHALRAALFHPARMQLLVAGDLSRRGAADPHVLLAAALAPPAASYAALAAASLAAMAAEGEGDDEDDEDDEDGEEEGEEEGEEGGAEGGGGGGGAEARAGVPVDHLGTMAAEAEAAAAALAAAPPPMAGLARGVAAHQLLVEGKAQAIVAPLAATESSYVVLQAAGIAPAHEHHAALRVVTEHLTALEGDFWLGLGSGLGLGLGLAL